MTLQTGIYEYLATHSAVRTLTDGGVYRDFAPSWALQAFAENDTPYVVVQLVSRTGHYHMTGVAAYADPVYQTATYAATATQRDTVADAVKGALEFFNGRLGSGAVRSIFLESTTDDVDRPEDGSEMPIWQRIQTWRVVGDV